MNDVEQVKERLDVAEVISGYIPLKQAGRNLKASCPFHQEKSASFMVSPEKGIWHCFGCNAGGDIFKFVMQYEGLEFREALELLARKAGVELKERPSDNKTNRKGRERQEQAIAWAVKYFQASLIQNKFALEYAAKKRMLGQQAIRDFQIGYSPDDWNALSNFLLRKNFSSTELVQAGLAGQKNERIYDMYRGRLMFTISDGNGVPVGFTGRVLDDEQLPKYLNTPQTDLYDKSKVIYGLHLAKESIRKHKEVILVEGNMDVVASHQAGVKNVVAASGTALTRQQLKSLSLLTKDIKVKLAFDMDSAGEAATERVVPIAQSLGLPLFVVAIPGGKDADEVIKSDLSLWKSAISSAKEIRDYWLDRSLKEFDLNSLLEKRKFLDRMLWLVDLYHDPAKDSDLEREMDINVDQRLFLERIEKVSGIEASVLQSELEKRSRNPRISTSNISSQRPAATIIKPPTKTARRLTEEAVLAFNLAYPEVRMSLDDLTPAHFADEDHQEIIDTLKGVGIAPAEDVAAGLPNHADYVKILALRGEEEFGSFAPAERSFEAFQLVGRLQTMTNKDTKSKLSRKLREAQEKGDSDLAKRLLVQYQTLISEND